MTDINNLSLNKKYFAAANTSSGFVSYYSEIFRGLNKLYIIKGGPGTGKSKLMFDIVNEAQNRGYDAEYFYCSSDSNSLDGIIIKDLDIGVIDGTAPHIADPWYPGASDEIIYLGDFWKTEKLVSKKDKIHELTDKKAEHYVSAYHYLSAYEMIYGEMLKLTEEALFADKMKAAVKRLLSDIKTDCGNSFKIENRFTDAVSMDGYVSFNSFYKIAKNRVIIRDKLGAGYFFTKELMEQLKEKQKSIIVSRDPKNPERINGIYLDDLSIAYIISESYNADDLNDKIVNMNRFIDFDKLKNHKAKLRFGKRCCESLMDGAENSFAEIKRLHFELETIYTSAMDFRKKEEYTKKLLIKIFK